MSMAVAMGTGSRFIDISTISTYGDVHAGGACTPPRRRRGAAVGGRGLRAAGWACCGKLERVVAGRACEMFLLAPLFAVRRDAAERPAHSLYVPLSNPIQ